MNLFTTSLTLVILLLGSKQQASAQSFDSYSVSMTLPCANNKPSAAFDIKEPLSNHSSYMLLLTTSLIHEKVGEATRQMQEWGFKNILLFGKDKAGYKGMVGEHSNFILLVYRGTITNQQKWADLAIGTVKAPSLGVPGRIHRGFRNEFKSLRREVEPILSSFATEEKPIIMVGHSLGGALANLTAAWWVAKGHLAPYLVTFGQPRVGDEEFSQWFTRSMDKRFLRVIHKKDIVPWVPPSKQAAPVFANLIKEGLDRPRAAVAKLFTKLGYDFHRSPQLHLLGDGLLQNRSKPNISDEVNYWQETQKEIHWPGSLAKWLQSLQPPFTEHVPDAYICSYHKIF